MNHVKMDDMDVPIPKLRTFRLSNVSAADIMDFQNMQNNTVCAITLSDVFPKPQQESKEHSSERKDVGLERSKIPIIVLPEDMSGSDGEGGTIEDRDMQAVQYSTEKTSDEAVAQKMMQKWSKQ